METFQELHVKGKPVFLYNVSNPWAASYMEYVGGRAIAMCGGLLARSNGYKPEECVPFELAFESVERIVRAVTIPVNFDMRNDYMKNHAELKNNFLRIINAGVSGINVEDDKDQIISRINLLRKIADQSDKSIFINARTNIFLKKDADQSSTSMLDKAIYKAEEFAAAGASGIFVPGLNNLDFICELCDRSPIPVNIMIHKNSNLILDLMKAGVSRISYSPGSYIPI